MICLGLNISEKLHYQHLFEKLGEAETQELLNNNKDHSRKRGRPPFFHSDTNLVFSHILVHSCRQKLCSSCNSGINLIIVLEYTFFQLFSNVEQIFQVWKIQKKLCKLPCCRSNEPLSKLHCTAFLARCALFEVATFFFLQLLVPNNSAFA